MSAAPTTRAQYTRFSITHYEHTGGGFVVVLHDLRRERQRRMLADDVAMQPRILRQLDEQDRRAVWWLAGVPYGMGPSANGGA